MTQLVLNIEKPSILPSLQQMLSTFEGVSIASPIRRTRKACAKKADPTLTLTANAEVTPELMAKIEKARYEHAHGLCKSFTTAEEACAWMDTL